MSKMVRRKDEKEAPKPQKPAPAPQTPATGWRFSDWAAL
jgi:hypothetical protein